MKQAGRSTGADETAWQRSVAGGVDGGECRAAWFEALMAVMLQANAAAAVFAAAGVTACTDVTGFGLAGHLLELLDSSRVSRVHLSVWDVPLYEGFAEVVSRGSVSSLHRDNAKMACRIQGPDPLPPAWLFDPQTSGGLLAGVRPEQTKEVLEKLAQAGYTNTAVIGTVVVSGTE